MKFGTVIVIAAAAMTLPVMASAEQANVEEVTALCVAMADEEGVKTDKTDTACGCLAEKISVDQALVEELETASTLPVGEERDQSYSAKMGEIYEMCGPWGD